MVTLPHLLVAPQPQVLLVARQPQVLLVAPQPQVVTHHNLQVDLLLPHRLVAPRPNMSRRWNMKRKSTT